MNWRERYCEIDGQFRELQMLVRDVGTHPQVHVMLKPATELTEKLCQLANANRHHFSPEVASAFDAFMNSASSHLSGVTRNPGTSNLALLMVAAVLRARLLPELNSKEPEWVERVELALLHLQRLLEVDRTVADEWKSAFDEGECELEKRGGVHFLSHRIFAFKADGGGGRTDLVLGAAPSLADVERTNAPLVLTEWKKVTGKTAGEREADFGSKLESAKVQLRRYRRGALAGTELHRVCFAIMVGEHELRAEPDSWLPTGEMVRVLAINVAPVQPSSKRKISSQV